MAVLVRGYPHRTGEHCASTALRNLLAHHGTELSEGMVFGLASGLGLFYIRAPEFSPTRLFHGRTRTLEDDFGRNTGAPLVDRTEPDDDAAWKGLRARLDRGEPVMVSTDTFYLRYHNTTSHFPGHRCVVVGYDDESRTVLIADRKFEEYQRCSFEELRHARNAPDYPMRSENQFGDVSGRFALGRPLEEAVRLALARNARAMLDPAEEAEAFAPSVSVGIPGMRELAKELPEWRDLDDWSWASRFGYQVIIKRGAGGAFFRSLFADFLREAAALVPEIGEALPAERALAIAARWCDVAALLKEQSERDSCDPALFTRAGAIVAELADAEEQLFQDALRVTHG